MNYLIWRCWCYQHFGYHHHHQRTILSYDGGEWSCVLEGCHFGQCIASSRPSRSNWHCKK